MPVLICGGYLCVTGDTLSMSSEESAVTAGPQHIPKTAAWRIK